LFDTAGERSWCTDRRPSCTVRFRTGANAESTGPAAFDGGSDGGRVRRRHGGPGAPDNGLVADLAGLVNGSAVSFMDPNGTPPPPPPPPPAPARAPRPPRRSASARHPLVVAGNAVFTILILIAIVVGGTLLIGKQRFEARGPLAEDKVVNIPRGLGNRDI